MKINEVIDYNPLEEGPVAQGLKKAAVGATVLFGLVAGGAQQAKADQCQINQDLDHIECTRSDGQGVWSARKDASGKPLTPEQIERNIQAAMKQLPPLSGQLKPQQQQQAQYPQNSYPNQTVNPPGYTGGGYQNAPQQAMPQFMIPVPQMVIPYGYNPAIQFSLYGLFPHGGHGGGWHRR